MKLMQNSYGYTVTLTTNLDLTTATVIRVRLTSPPASGLGVLDKHLTHNDVTSAATGVVTLPINPGDLPVPGYYRIESFDETPGRRVISTVGQVEVDATLDTDSSDTSAWVSTPDIPYPGVVSDHAMGLEVAGNVDAASFTIGGHALVLYPDVTADGLTPGGLDSLGGYTVPTPAAPVAAPTLSAVDSPGGVPVGTWLYAIAWHIISTGFNTPLGPTASITLTAESAVTITPPTMPTTADGYYVWRSNDGGTAWMGADDMSNYPDAVINPGTTPVIDTQNYDNPLGFSASPTSTGTVIRKDGSITMQAPMSGNHWLDIHSNGGATAISVHNDAHPEHSGGVFQVGSDGSIEASGELDLAGHLIVGSLTDTSSDINTFYRALEVFESPGQVLNDDPTLDVRQGALNGTLMVQDRSGNAIQIYRLHESGGFNYLDPVIQVWDLSDSPADLVAISKHGLANLVMQARASGQTTFGYGVGIYGHVPTATTPRTLAQSVIDAITDANAKTAMQALANALADIGALTLT